MRVRAPNVGWDDEVLVEQHIHTLPHQSQHTFSCTTRSRQQIAGAYLVEFPISTVKDHLEGNVGPILDAWNSRPVGRNADASGRARSFEIIDDELVCAGSGVEVVKGFGGSCGGEQYTDWGELRTAVGQDNRKKLGEMI